MNLFDILILLGIATGGIIGFIRGFLHQVVGIVSLYLSLILAVYLHRPLAQLLRFLFPNFSREANQSVGFLFILIIMLNVFSYIGKEIREAGGWSVGATLQYLGGMVLGFILACFWISLAVTFLSLVTRYSWLRWDSFRQIIRHGLRSSALVGVFQNLFPVIMHTLLPWIPDRLMEIVLP